MASGFEESLLDEYDDSTLLDYVNKAPRSAPRGGVRFLSPNLVSKAGGAGIQTDALKSMDLARRLGIRVPAVKRILKVQHTLHTSLYTVMERVDGLTLHDCWHQLSWFTTFKLAFQLRQFVCKMRSQTFPTAGGLHTGGFHSIWIEDLYGLPKDASSLAVAEYFNFWGNFVHPPQGQRPKRPEKLKTRFSTTAPLFFTHQDLAPRNLMVDKKGQLWLVDWNLSGWYPIYMEYVGMQNFYIPTWGWFDRLRWRIFSWISVGRYEAERKAIAWGQSRSVEARLGRYEEVLVEGADPWDLTARKPGL